ncbi:thiamine pyrophosphokinase [Candidatus Haliotispira prima]|uniref:Thiamine pyrophosphokinase n=1 Tax=Candidatus Haliotispira prima TaxID=3034016 RepID=A0ABY8MGA8_9SPIO|nr:thiamine pyrophosphokinase [Candidatus Haliotispira prima]
MPQTQKLHFDAALLLSGEAPDAEQLALFLPAASRRQLCWVAADGGCRYASRYRVEPEAVIGDFDSVPGDWPAGAEKQLRFSPDKDESDRNLAVEYLIDQGYHHIVQVGGGGGRSDHFLAMIYDYRLRRYPIMPKLWLTHREAIFYLEEGERLELDFGPGAGLDVGLDAACQTANHVSGRAALLSGFPLTPETLLQSKQLKWPLDNVDPRERDGAVPGNSLPYSLSNWTTDRRAEISVVRGAALVFYPYPPSPTAPGQASPFCAEIWQPSCAALGTPKNR